MKIVLTIIISLSIFSAVLRTDEHKSHLSNFSQTYYEDKSVATSFIREVIYNYITSLSSTIDIVYEKVPVFSQLKQKSFKKTQEKILSNRHLIKHYVEVGETLDSIIKRYNHSSNINMNDFREFIRVKNNDKISTDYSINSGDLLLVPSE